MTSYEIWLFLHISAAAVWIGGAVTGQVFGALTKRAANPIESAGYGRNMGLTARWVFLPSSILVLLTGAALTEDGNWEWSEPFVWLGVIGWAIVTFAAFGYMLRAMGRVGARMAEEGPSPELGAQMDRLVLLARILILVLFAVVFVMVVKPGT